MSAAAAGPRTALVTGVSREIGIGRAVARKLAGDGLVVATAGSRAYDARMPWGADVHGTVEDDLAFEVDLERPDAAAELLDAARERAGPVDALVMCHAESVDSDLRTTDVASFDRHMAVNARATWLLVKAFAERFEGPYGAGRIVAMTSDHSAWNLPYGASKGAMDRIVLAAAHELADRGITANVINPGPTDTGWMSPDVRRLVAERTLLGRVGVPDDVANLVSFLCSSRGGWINAQLLHSDGGRAHR